MLSSSKLSQVSTSCWCRTLTVVESPSPLVGRRSATSGDTAPAMTPRASDDSTYARSSATSLVSKSGV